MNWKIALLLTRILDERLLLQKAVARFFLVLCLFNQFGSLQIRNAGMGQWLEILMCKDLPLFKFVVVASIQGCCHVVDRLELSILVQH